VTWTIVASCLLAGAPFTLKWLDLFPANGTELSIIVFFGIRAIASVPLAVVPIVINSQMVDVADEHELQTGNRAEGLIFSVRLFAVKASNGLGAMLAGFGLEYIDFPENARIETLDPAVIDNLMFMMGPLYYLIVFSGLGFVLMYRLYKSRHEEILRELEVRRRSAQAHHHQQQRGRRRFHQVADGSHQGRTPAERCGDLPDHGKGREQVFPSDRRVYCESEEDALPGVDRPVWSAGKAVPTA